MEEDQFVGTDSTVVQTPLPSTEETIMTVEENGLANATRTRVSSALILFCWNCDLKMLTEIGVVVVVGILGLAYQATKPPPPKICGSPGGPPVTSPRIRLSDGRSLAYKEKGVPKEVAKYKIIVIHGFDSSKDVNLAASQELIDELGIYFLSFDRAGYGESDPNPKRSVKSEAYDIQELADQLQIGSKLAGVSLVVPMVNFWWPSFPVNLSQEGLKKKLVQDQWAFRVAHYAPRLLYWWLTQKWFPSLSAMSSNPPIFSRRDKEILTKMSAIPDHGQDKVRQQGVFESLHRDLMVAYSNWEFDPMDLTNPFPENERSVHIWQGYEDRMIPFELQRYVAEKLPWIQYHEVPDGGHLIIHDSSLCEAILRALLLGEELSNM
ncbi:hypothetical protein HHK36_016825 [Tetracentron sinense]|uniref:AB hydrolase-1 domain-containing protein n=1 Tax=Tetracentron sinense TaxID=13715 RepID=A0A834Z1F9_TETSI|nr:hypothetical protein HHK36_016825 [Tetracentron sinense]